MKKTIDEKVKGKFSLGYALKQLAIPIVISIGIVGSSAGLVYGVAKYYEKIMYEVQAEGRSSSYEPAFHYGLNKKWSEDVAKLQEHYKRE